MEAGTFDLYMMNESAIGGFQAQFTGISVTGASGGLAEGAAVSYTHLTLPTNREV